MSTYHATYVANYRPALRRMLAKLAAATLTALVLLGVWAWTL